MTNCPPPSGTLREQVAQAIRDEIYPPGGVLSGGAWDELVEAGVAAIGVVLAMVADEIDREFPAGSIDSGHGWGRRKMLAVVERLRG